MALSKCHIGISPNGPKMAVIGIEKQGIGISPKVLYKL